MARHDDGPIGDDQRLDERLLGDHRVDGRLERGLVLRRLRLRTILRLQLLTQRDADGPVE